MTTTSIVITPRSKRVGMWEELRELWKYRSLIRILVERDLRVRYKNSVIGIGWTMVSPLINVFVLTVAIGYILGTGPKNLSAYIFCATLPFTFFNTGILDSSTAVLAKISLIKKIYFPREIPVISMVLQNFVQFLISLGVFIVYRWGFAPLLLHSWPGPPPLEVLWLPVITAILFFLILGTAFFVSAANVFYEDVKFVLTMLLGFLFYLMPIIYPAENIYYAERIPPHLRSLAYHLYLANPLAWIVTAFRQIFLPPFPVTAHGVSIGMTAPLDYRYFAITAVTSLLICYAGYAYFNSRKWDFTERP